jgi:sugar phosphate isomerase/epimerase
LMRLGIFAKTFPRSSLGETLDAVRAHEMGCVQFNMSCAGLHPMPEEIPPELVDCIREEMNRRDLTTSAVSGTFNMIHPDPTRRGDGLRRLEVLAGACRRMGTSVITLCTGTRDHWQELRYLAKVETSGKGRVTPIPVVRYGHCNFTSKEVLGAFNLLVGQVT